VKSFNPNILVILLCAVCFAHGQDTRTRRAEPQNLDVIKVDSNLVSVPVIVSDREGRYVPNLTVEQFKLFDNTTQQKITYFDAAEQPLNIAILLDTSRSTEGALDDIKKAAKNFLKELRPQDRAMVVSFDYEVRILSSLTNDRKTLEQGIKSAKVGRLFGTTLNDAVAEIANKQFRNVSGRKAIILLSDGQDFGSVTATDSLLRDQAESDTMVYSVYFAPEFQRNRPGPFGFPSGRRRGVWRQRFNHAGLQRQRPGPGGRRRNAGVDGAEFLRELSEVTSGRFYQSEVTDLKGTFSLIAEELRHQYRLGFYPGELQRDGSLHQLRVKVDVTNVAVRARQQYRAQ
jgi:VWFA-related protein